MVLQSLFSTNTKVQCVISFGEDFRLFFKNFTLFHFSFPYVTGNCFPQRTQCHFAGSHHSKRHREISKKKEERKKEKIAHWVWFGIRKLVNCLSILFFFCDNFLTAIIIISLFHCLIHRGIQILQSQIAYPTLLRALTRLANHFNFRLMHIRLNCN